MLGRERKEPFLFLTTQLNKVKALSSSFFPPPSSLSLMAYLEVKKRRESRVEEGRVVQLLCLEVF